jgi:putative inorganic carbon (HCO3(-)) transporter
MMAAMRRWLDAIGIAVGVAMLGFLALSPDRGWIACLGIAAALAMVAAGRGSLRGIPAPWAIVLLGAMPLVALAVTPLPAVGRAQMWLLWGSIGAFCLICVWARTRERLLWIGAGLAGAGAMLSLASPFAVNWIIERKTFVPPAVYEVFPRLVSDPIHPNVMASLMVGLMFVPLAWAISPPVFGAAPRWLSRLMSSRPVWAVAVFLPALVLFLTKSRGGYAAAAVGLVLIALLMIRRRRWFLWILLGGLAVGIAAILWWPGGLPISELSEVEALGVDTIAFRQRVWQYALFLIGDFPFTGVGMRAFNDVLFSIYGYQAVRDPGAHNVFLQIALDLGIPGLLAFVALAATVLARAARAYSALRRAGDSLWVLAAGGIAGVAATLAQGLVDIAAWGTRGSFVLWCLLGMLAALAHCLED